MMDLLQSGASNPRVKAQQPMANLGQHVDWDLALGYDTEDWSITRATVEKERVADIASLVESDSTLLPDWDRSCKVHLFMAD